MDRSAVSPWSERAAVGAVRVELEFEIALSAVEAMKEPSVAGLT
jgi:hypothetical protein